MRGLSGLQVATMAFTSTSVQHFGFKIQGLGLRLPVPMVLRLEPRLIVWALPGVHIYQRKNIYYSFKRNIYIYTNIYPRKTDDPIRGPWLGHRKYERAHVKAHGNGEWLGVSRAWH